jgi:uncharacterized protein (TIGR02466 family)
VTQTVRSLFATPLAETRLDGRKGFAHLRDDLEQACRQIAEDDRAGRAWCRQNSYRGYTSYASLADLPTRATAFGLLKRQIDREVDAFAAAAQMDLGNRRLCLDSLWINILKSGGGHTGHIHPHSVVSGTFYVATPPGSGALKLEDPRLPMMMAAPPRQADAPEAQRHFVYLSPAPGTLYLWESWLRHEVTPNTGRAERISISFNYGWS